ncbi:LexA family transcriptional regulator [Delftia sp. PS-11]|uniref:LexA family transcriptional regulator n=1 Tax=Delftia sp. PS-11 TaxID=2767222 RepID=UPI00245523EC|nr:S24 family peptidase [Delftia sp. PS-11]KAJ8741795.1 helix-turn-helix transcriptional regulator [Delftia sp. PS-11]
MDLKDRIREAFASTGLTQTAFAAKIGVSKGAVSQWLNGTNQDLRGANAQAIEGLTGYRAGWLVNGEEPKLAPPLIYADGRFTEEVPAELVVRPSNFRKIWVLGKSSGGYLPERIWDDAGCMPDMMDMYAELGSSDPDAFLSEVIGQSMYPKYESRNFALIEPATPIDIEDCVLVRLQTGATMLKRLLSRRNGMITLGSYNDPAILNFDDSEISWMYYAAHEVPRKKIKTRY